MISTALLLGLLNAQAPSVFIPSWSGLAEPYTYVRSDAYPFVDKKVPDPKGVRYNFSFKSESGDTVYGVFVRPKADKAYPCVLLLHGLGGSKDDFVAQAESAILDKGLAFAAIDAPGHGARATKQDQETLGKGLMLYLSGKEKRDLLKTVVSSPEGADVSRMLLRAVVEGVKDERRAIDYLTSRKDVDYHRIGLGGVSMGSIMGTILASVDTRVRAMVLMVGGDPVFPLLHSFPSDLQGKAVLGAPSLYAPHFQLRPVHMINGNRDSVMPRQATDRLYDAFPKGRKSISWYASDHELPRLAWTEAIDWMRRALK